MNQGAVFKQDKSVSKHNTNVDYHQYNFRANVDANMTKTTLLSLNMETIITKRNSPGYGDNNNALWSAQANLPATIVPVKYSNGTLPSFGRNSYSHLTIPATLTSIVPRLRTYIMPQEESRMEH